LQHISRHFFNAGGKEGSFFVSCYIKINLQDEHDDDRSAI